MINNMKSYGSIGIAVVTVFISLITQWAVFGVRLSNVESRQDRQSAAIVSLQDNVAQQQANYAALSAKIDALTDNVSYIRSRIDSAIKSNVVQ